MINLDDSNGDCNVSDQLISAYNVYATRKGEREDMQDTHVLIDDYRLMMDDNGRCSDMCGYMMH
jgi:hypothetical protein